MRLSCIKHIDDLCRAANTTDSKSNKFPGARKTVQEPSQRKSLSSHFCLAMNLEHKIQRTEDLKHSWRMSIHEIQNRDIPLESRFRRGVQVGPSGGHLWSTNVCTARSQRQSSINSQGSCGFEWSISPEKRKTPFQIDMFRILSGAEAISIRSTPFRYIDR